MTTQSMSKEKRNWLVWFKTYGADKFLNSFLASTEGAQSTCKNCKEHIYVDVLIGGGVPDWSTEDGDFGCLFSPYTNDEGTGGHEPIKRGER